MSEPQLKRLGSASAWSGTTAKVMVTERGRELGSKTLHAHNSLGNPLGSRGMVQGERDLSWGTHLKFKVPFDYSLLIRKQIAP